MKQLIINTTHIKANLRRVKEMAGSAIIYAVLKGDAYGMGLTQTADLLAREGIDHFAVTEPSDAVTLREAGHEQAEILLLRSTAEPDDIHLCLDHNITLTLGSEAAVLAVNGIAEQRSSIANAHLEIDVGMGRYGFLPTETDAILHAYQYANNIAFNGIYTHFPAAFGSVKKTLAQKAQFDAVLAFLRAQSIDVGTVHAANSSALFFVEDTQYDAVRIGSALTGRLPRKHRSTGLTPATRVTCTICETRWLAKGCTIGYAGVYKTKRPTKIAILPIGGADGFCVGKIRDSYRFRDALGYALSDAKRWLLRRKITVSINGKKVRVLGHTGMNHTVVDITNHDIGVGSLATIELNPVYAAQLPRIYE